MRRALCWLFAGLMLAGCGAGQRSQTADQRVVVTGAQGDVDDEIGLRDVWIPVSSDPSGRYRPGSEAPVLGTVVNHGHRVDELVTVSSPVAAEVSVSGSTRVPPGRNAVSTTEPTPQASPLVVGTMRIVLTANQVLPAGQDIPVEFRFRMAGRLTLEVPVAEPQGR